MSITYPVSLRGTPKAAVKPGSLARNGAVALAIRLTGAGGMLLVHILLARYLGVGGFGDYSLALVWLQFLCVFGKSGLDNTTLRYVSEYQTNHDEPALRGFTRISIWFTRIASCLVSIVFLALIYVERDSISPGLAGCLAVAAIMVPLVCVRQVQEAAIRARGLVVQSQISTTIWPLLLLVLVAIAGTTLERKMSAVGSLCVAFDRHQRGCFVRRDRVSWFRSARGRHERIAIRTK